ncbi:hypothetical protein MHBO_005213, partial [Bonamia ostreae]
SGKDIDVATTPTPLWKPHDHEKEMVEELSIDGLVRAVCGKHDHQCNDCPIGSKRNGGGMDCEGFRKTYPATAIEIMRKELI